MPPSPAGKNKPYKGKSKKVKDFPSAGDDTPRKTTLSELEDPVTKQDFITMSETMRLSIF